MPSCVRQAAKDSGEVMGAILSPSGFPQSWTGGKGNKDGNSIRKTSHPQGED